jgi:hypothetical protein
MGVKRIARRGAFGLMAAGLRVDGLALVLLLAGFFGVARLSHLLPAAFESLRSRAP